jgi:hypothetical protein
MAVAVVTGAQISAWLELFTFTLGSLCGLGLIGGFLISPFRARYKFLLSPLVGIMILSTGIGVLYGVAHLPFYLSALGTALPCILLTLWRLKYRALLSMPDLLPPLATAIVLVAISVSLHTVTTARYQSPSISLGDAPDQSNYAQVSDWIRQHRVTHLLEPVEDPVSETLPRILMTTDPRAGSFYFLAAIASLQRGASLFAFDTACAVVWVAAILGVASVFAENLLVLLFLIIGLMVSAWFDYDRSGFLAKGLAYPTALVVAGLFCSGRLTTASLCALAWISLGSATMHPGVTTALIVGTIGGAYTVIHSLAKRSLQLDLVLPLGILVCIAIATTGILSYQSWQVGYPDWSVKWPYIIPRVLDLENQGIVLSGLGPDQLVIATIMSVCLWFGLSLIAIRMDECAAALLVGPAVLLAALWWIGAEAATFQLIGMFYPATVCGAALLLIQARRASLATAVIIFALASTYVLARVPRFLGAVERYASPLLQDRAYTAEMLNQIRKFAGNSPVLIDTSSPQMARLFRGFSREIQIQWTDRAWHESDLDRLWRRETPVYSEAARFVLRSAMDANSGADNETVIWRSPSLILTSRTKE